MSDVWLKIKGLANSAKNPWQSASGEDLKKNYQKIPSMVTCGLQNTDCRLILRVGLGHHHHHHHHHHHMKTIKYQMVECKHWQALTRIGDSWPGRLPGSRTNYRRATWWQWRWWWWWWGRSCSCSSSSAMVICGAPSDQHDRCSHPHQRNCFWKLHFLFFFALHFCKHWSRNYC